MVVERAIQDTHIPNTLFMDMMEALAYLLQRSIPYGVAHSTNTEGTRIETSTSSLYLHKGLIPGEERTFLGSMQQCKILNTGKTIVSILTRDLIYIAQPSNAPPSRTIVPYVKPVRETLLSLTTQHTVHLGMMNQIGLVISQELRST